MCGKAKSKISPSKIADIIKSVQEEEENINLSSEGNILNDEPLEKFDNIVPGMHMYVAYIDPITNYLEIEEMQWGFKGYGKGVGGIIFNTRFESIIEKKTFSNLMEKNRAIVIINGYYENYKIDNKSTKDNYYITNKDEMLILPALYRHQNYGIKLFTILTKEASSGIKSIHKRQPLILKKNKIISWLNTNKNDKFDAIDLLI